MEESSSQPCSVLGFDIGIKHLAMCHLLYPSTPPNPQTIPSIIQWSLIDLTTSTTPPTTETSYQPLQCTFTGKTGKHTCKRQAEWIMIDKPIDIDEKGDEESNHNKESIYNLFMNVSLSSVRCSKHISDGTLAFALAHDSQKLPKFVKPSRFHKSPSEIIKDADEAEEQHQSQPSTITHNHKPCYFCFTRKSQLPTTMKFSPDIWIRFPHNSNQNHHVAIPFCSSCFRRKDSVEFIKNIPENWGKLHHKDLSSAKFSSCWPRIGGIDFVGGDTWKVDPLETVAHRWIDFCRSNRYFMEHPPSYIWVENQPTLTNPTMKSIQMIVATALWSIFPSAHIRWISPNLKWLAFQVQTTTNYRDHKNLSNERMKEWLETQAHEKDRLEWLPVFLQHRKRDDLADAFWILIAGLYQWNPVPLSSSS